MFAQNGGSKFFMKGFTICANVVVKGIYTSDLEYVPDKALGQDVWNDDIKLALKVPKGKQFGDVHSWLSIPERAIEPRTVVDSSEQPPKNKQSIIKKGQSSTRSGKHVQFQSGSERDDQNNQDLSNLGESPQHSNQSESKLDSQQFQVPKTRIQSAQKKVQDVSNPEANFDQAPLFDHDKSKRRASEQFKLRPDPIMALDKIIGVHPSLTTKQVSFSSTSNNQLFYTQANAVIRHDTKTQAQKILMDKQIGLIHRMLVCKQHLVTLSWQELNTKRGCCDHKSHGEILLTVWCLEDFKVVKHLKPPLKSIQHLDISADQTALCLSGKDLHHDRELILVYSFQDLVRFKKIELLCRQQADFALNALKFVTNSTVIGVGQSYMPASALEGKEQLASYDQSAFIRVFKIKNNYMPNQLVALNQTALNTLFCGIANRIGAKGSASLVYVTTRCGKLYIVNYLTRQVEKVLQLHDCQIQAILIQQTFVFTASTKGSLKLWAPQLDKLLSEVEVNQQVTSCSVSPDGSQIAVFAECGTVSVLQMDTSSFKVIVRSHKSDIIEVCHNQSADSLVSIGSDSSIKVWDSVTLEQVHEFNTAESDPPTRVVSCPASGLVAVGFTSGFLRLLAVKSLQISFETMLFEAAVMDVQFTQTVKFMGVFYRNSKLVIFNMEDSQAVPIKNIDFEFPLGRTSYSLAFSADCQFIAHVSSNANTVQVWEMKSLEPKWTVDLIGDTVTKVMFARNARDLLVLTTDAKLKYFRYHSEVGEVEPFREQYGVTDLEPTDCVISPNNKFIICAGVDGHIKVYDYLMRGSLIPAVQVFLGHLQHASALCMQQDMKYVYSVGPGCGIYRWAFYGDSKFSDELIYEPTQGEAKRAEIAAEQAIEIPPLKQEELLQINRDEVKRLRQDIFEGKEEPAGTHKVPGVEDGGVTLKKDIKPDYTTNYTFEQHKIEVLKLLGCSVAPHCGQNLVWDQKQRCLVYSMQNKLIFEQTNQDKTQLLKQEFNDPIHGVEISENQKLILAYTRFGTLDGFPQIIVWCTTRRRKVSQLTMTDAELKCVQFSNLSNTLLVVTYNAQLGKSTVSLWDFLDNRKEVLAKAMVPFEIHEVRWSPRVEKSHDEFATISGKIYHYWRVTNTLQMQFQIGRMQSQEFKGTFTALSYVQPSPEQSSIYMLIGLSTGHVWVLDSKTNSFILSVKLMDSAIHKMTTSMRRILVEAKQDTAIRCWYLKKVVDGIECDASNPNQFFTGQSTVLTLDGFPSASSFDDGALEGLVISSNNTIWLVNFDEGLTIKIKSCHEPTAKLNAVDFRYVQPDQFQSGATVQHGYTFDQNFQIGSVGGNDGLIKLWSMYDLEHLLNFNVPQEQCTALAMHPFRPYMVCAFTDGNMRFFDIEKAKALGRCSTTKERQNRVDPVIFIRFLHSGEHLLCSTKLGHIFLVFVEGWSPLSMTVQSLAELKQSVSGFDVSMTEPYNKWLVGGCSGTIFVYNRQDSNSFKQEIFDKNSPPKFVFMDSFDVKEYVDNCFTEAKRISTLDHYYNMTKPDETTGSQSADNETEARFLNCDNASYICFIRKCNALFIRNFDIHQVMKRIDLTFNSVVHMEMAPGSAPYVHLITDANDIVMLDFINEQNTTEVRTMHESVKTLKVCPNGKYLLTAGERGDIALWSILKIKPLL